MQGILANTMRFTPVLAILLTGLLCTAMFPLTQFEHAKSTALEPANKIQQSDSNTTGWLAGASGSSVEYIEEMIPLENGSTLIGGTFDVAIEFYGDVLGYNSDDPGVGVDFFLAWLDENGTWTGSMSESSQGLDAIAAMGKTSEGNIIVSGVFCAMTRGSACSLTLGDLEPLNKNDDEDENAVFLASLSPNGEWLWAEAFTSQYQLSVADLLVTSNDEIHITFAHRGDIVYRNTTVEGQIMDESVDLFAMDLYGNLLYWNTILSSESLEGSSFLCQDDVGNTYIAMDYIQDVFFGDHELLGSTVSRVAVAQYDVNGWLWANSTGGDGDSTVKACTARPGGDWELWAIIYQTSRWAIMNFRFQLGLTSTKLTFHPTEIGCSPRDTEETVLTMPPACSFSTTVTPFSTATLQVQSNSVNLRSPTGMA